MGWKQCMALPFKHLLQHRAMTPDEEIYGMGELPHHAERYEPARPSSPPWWVWIIVSIALAEGAWFGNAVVTLQAQVAAIAATEDARYAALDQNVEMLLQAWRSGH